MGVPSGHVLPLRATGESSVYRQLSFGVRGLSSSVSPRDNGNSSFSTYHFVIRSAIARDIYCVCAVFFLDTLL